MSRADQVQQIDDIVDAWWERLRGHPLLDRVYFAATNAGEFSAVWHSIGVLRAIRGRWTWSDAARFSAIMGLESLIVNQGVKRLFGRVRPSTAADNTSDLHLRQPVTSSFPSGHSSAAFCAAILLAPASRAPTAVRVVAGLVSTSRIHVRLHHASDVAAGAVTGVALGRIAARLVRRQRLT